MGYALCLIMNRVILRIDPLLVNIANDNRVVRKNRFVASNIAKIVKLCLIPPAREETKTLLP